LLEVSIREHAPDAFAAAAERDVAQRAGFDVAVEGLQ
jgi:hypothetical protein